MQVKHANGAAAEELAAVYLTRRGLTILDRNFRIRGGEIDLICKDGPTLVFVEVRLRTRHDYGGGVESITAVKRRRLILAARHYLAGKPESSCRFDVIVLDRLTEAHILWLKGAFDAD